jgi:hypothetical protein
MSPAFRARLREPLSVEFGIFFERQLPRPWSDGEELDRRLAVGRERDAAGTMQSSKANGQLNFAGLPQGMLGGLSFRG